MSDAESRKFFREHGMFLHPLMGSIFDFVEEKRARPNGRTPFDDEIEVIGDVVYKTVDGEELKMDIYLPSHPIDGRAPLVMDIPGGGWMIHNRAHRDGYAKCFAAMGAVVAVIDHRLCPKVFFPENLGDCADAYNYLVDHADELNIDPENITVTGDSSGGHLTACLGALATHPTYASELNLPKPKTTPSALIFVSGAFSIKVMHRIPFTHLLMVRYISGQKSRRAYKKWEYAKYIEPYDFVTSNYPKCYNNGGASDLLCFGEAARMSALLDEKGVTNSYDIGRSLFNSGHCYVLRFPFKSARKDALKLYDFYFRTQTKRGVDLSAGFERVEKFFADYKNSLKGRAKK